MKNKKHSIELKNDMQINKNIVNDRLRTLRKNKNLTQAKLSELLGISEKTYKDYENQNHNIPSDMLFTLAKFFDVSTDYILGLEEHEKNDFKIINEYTGLNDNAIKGLIKIKKTDTNQLMYSAAANKLFNEKNHNILNLITILNFIITSGFLLNFLNHLQTLFRPGYQIPVVFDDQGNATQVCDKNIDNQYYPGCHIKGYNISEHYKIYLAADEHNLHDCEPLQINSDFVKAVALKQIDNDISKLQTNWENSIK